MFDFTIKDEQYFVSVTPLSLEGEGFLKETVNERQWYNGSVVVQHENKSDFISLLLEGGYTVEGYEND